MPINSKHYRYVWKTLMSSKRLCQDSDHPYMLLKIMKALRDLDLGRKTRSLLLHPRHNTLNLLINSFSHRWDSHHKILYNNLHLSSVKTLRAIQRMLHQWLLFIIFQLIIGCHATHLIMICVLLGCLQRFSTIRIQFALMKQILLPLNSKYKNDKGEVRPMIDL